MCRAVRCRACGKTTWAGCGQHVSQVKARVEPGQWCSGHPKAPGQEADRAAGLWAKLLRR